MAWSQELRNRVISALCSQGAATDLEEYTEGLNSDDTPVEIGADADIALTNQSAALAANTAVTGVLVGTPVTPALAANSLIVGNVTASGDMLFAANRGGNSEGYLWIDSSAGDLTLYAPLGEILLNPTTDVQILNGTGLIVGHTAQITISDGDGTTNLIPEVQVLGTTKTDASVVIGSFNTTDGTTVAPSLNFLKSGNATIGSNTIVASGEILGEITFFGADGTDFETPGARIYAAVNGTPGAGDMPTDLVLQTTPDGSETLATRFTVGAEGAITVSAMTTPASVAGATGTAAPTAFTMTGGLGGNTTIATTGTGGVGGGIEVTLGAGGTANSATTAATGGAGGAWSLTMGAGGAAAVAGVTATGGAGGAWTGTTGAGGAVSLAVSGTATGGASGAITFATGTGGAVTATTGTNVGGASGAISIRSGTGGAATAATDTGGASGAVTIGSGTGGAGDTGGVSGSTTIITGAVGAGGSPTAGSILFSPAAVEAARMTLLQMFIGDTTNANITQGLTINQGANDDQILALKSSDVAHVVTTLAEADTYGSFAKVEATTGGLLIGGYKDGDGAVLGEAVIIRGVLDEAAADTTKSTAGVGIISLNAGIEVTNSIGDAGANENLVVVRNNATTRFILDADGDSHQDVGTAWTNYSDHDDVALLARISAGVSRRDDPLRHRFGEFLDEHKRELEDLKLVTFQEDGHHFMNMSRLSMLLTGAAIQMGKRIAQLEQSLAKLTGPGGEPSAASRPRINFD